MKWLWSSWRKHWKLKPKLTYIHHLCVYQRWVRVVDLQRKAVSPCGADCHEVWWQITHITKEITKASLVLIKVYTWRVKERVRERDKKLEREREREFAFTWQYEVPVSISLVTSTHSLHHSWPKVCCTPPQTYPMITASPVSNIPHFPFYPSACSPSSSSPHIPALHCHKHLLT